MSSPKAAPVGGQPPQPLHHQVLASNNLQQGVSLVLDVLSGDTIVLATGKISERPKDPRNNNPLPNVEFKNGDFTTRKIVVAGVVAPRLGRGNDTKDEPGGWASKEFLRKELLGKKVQWRELYRSQSGDSVYCELRYPDAGSDKTHLGVKILSAGWGRTMQGSSAKSSLPMYDDLVAAENSAMINNLGIWGLAGEAETNDDVVVVRDVVNLNQGCPADFDLTEYFEKNKNILRKGIVEHIKDANNYRVCLLPCGDEERFVTMAVNLSGVQNPVVQRVGPKEVEQEPDSGAFFARAFALERILGREVEVRLESMTRGSNANAPPTIMASILHPAKGSIAEFFLDLGFGYYVDWSGQSSYSGPEKLMACQQRAKEGNLRRWKDKNKSDGVDHFEFIGKVVEIVSGDQLKIVNIADPVGKRTEVRYYLSSLKAPSLREEQAKTQIGLWRPASIEYIRKKLIGKQFRVRLDYKKNFSNIKDSSGMLIQGPAPSDEKTKDCFFVTLTENVPKDKLKSLPYEGNPYVEIVQSGMVGLTPSYGEESMSQRSIYHGQYLEAERIAKEGNKGIHGEKPPTPEVMTELVLPTGAAAGSSSSSSSKNKTGGTVMGMKGRRPTTKRELSECSKAYEQQLVAKGKQGHECLINYVISGSRVRVKLLHEKIHLTFAVNGVKCPNAPRSGPTDEFSGSSFKTAEQKKLDQLYAPQPFGAESLQFAREHLMQQEARVVIDRCDPAGTFTGTLYVGKDGQPNSKKTEDFALTMIKRGLAYCDEWCSNDMYWNAQEQAAKDKVNWWSIDHEAGEELVVDPKALANGSSSSANGSSGGSGAPIKGEVCYINDLNDFYIVQNGDDKKISTQINSEVGQCENIMDGLQKRNIYLAQPWGEKNWYRAKFVGRGQEGGKFCMYFLDSGSYSDSDHVRKLKPGSSLNSLPPACIRCGLYGVKSSPDVWEDACSAFFKKTSTVSVEGTIEKVEWDKNAEPGQQAEVKKVVLYTTTALKAAADAQKSMSNGGNKNVIATPVSLNEYLIKECLVRLSKKESSFSVLSRVDYKQWILNEGIAKKTRTKLWKHGTPDSDDDDDGMF